MLDGSVGQMGGMQTFEFQRFFMFLTSAVSILVYLAVDNSGLIILGLSLFVMFLHLGFPMRFSPVVAPAALFQFTGLVGYLSAASKNSTFGTSIHLILSPNLRSQTLSLFSLSSIALLLGSNFVRQKVSRNADIPYQYNRKVSIFTILATLVPMGGMLIGFHFSDFLSRPDHLMETNIPIIARAGSALSLLAVPALGILGSNQKRLLKVSSGLLILTYGLLFFAMSSRSLVVVPISLVLLFRGRITIWTKVQRWILLPIGVMFGLSIPLYLRSLREHGLISYISEVWKFRVSRQNTLETFQNFTVAFDLNGLTAFALPKFPLRDFYVEISPFLGNSAGWYEISESHRFNFATPTTALGELLNYGLFELFLVLILIGLTSEILNRRTQMWKSTLRQVGNVLLFAGMLYFGTLCIQYNLRSAVRIIYYLVGLVLIMNFSVTSPFRSTGIKSEHKLI